MGIIIITIIADEGMAGKAFFLLAGGLRATENPLHRHCIAFERAGNPCFVIGNKLIQLKKIASLNENCYYSHS
ncbi:hypothetical protein [Noviherbaspirillum agri]